MIQHYQILVAAIRDNITLPDETAEALVENEGTNEAKKRLAVGLKCCGVISEDQAAYLFYQWPMGDV